MNTTLSPHKDDHHKVEGSSEKIQEDILSYNLEINITEGGEFLDDAIRMKDQPLEETAAMEIEEQIEMKMKSLSRTLKTGDIVNQKNENFMITTEQKTAKPQSNLQGVKNVVLVHGAFADGSSWARVIPLLQAKGFNVIAVQNPLTSFEDDVAATKRAIARMDGPVLLAAHSYGGMVITEAGNDPKVVGLVYVDALIPDDGQSAVDVIQPYPPSPGNKEFQQDASGFLSLSLKGINSHFAQDLNEEDRGVLFATQIPWAASATLTKITKAAWKNKPSWCIIGLDDETVPPQLTKAGAKMINATTLELKSSHVPMLSQPGKVADFIIEAAGQG